MEYSIGQISASAGVAASALRYYERLGLLSPRRRVGGKRRYGEEALSRLAVIQVARALGFSLAEIRVLIDGIARGDRSPRRLQALARKKLPEVEATLVRAALMARVLRAAEHCRCPSLDACVKAVHDAGLLHALDLGSNRRGARRAPE